MQLKESGDKAIALLSSQEPVLTHYSASLTMADAIYQPSIRSLVKSIGEEFVGTSILALLKEFLVFVPNSLTPPEVASYADKILSYRPNWSMGDLILCLKNGMEGKYGINKYHWKWNPDFIEWVRLFEQDKDDYFFKKHTDKINASKLENADLIKLFPKELMEKFSKETLVDNKKQEAENLKVPADVVAQGVVAVDEWIEQARKTKK